MSAGSHERRRGSAAEPDSLEARLGYRFRDPSILEKALTHRSFAHEQRTGEEGDYERLEFLGDALLGFLVSEWLYADDRSADEGALTRRRQAIVRLQALADAARRLGLGEVLRLGQGEERTGGRKKTSLLGDAFEAILGAVFVDGGIRPARAFVRRHLGGVLAGVRRGEVAPDDFKTRLQEAAQARLRLTPRYRIVTMSGPAHALQFEAEVRIGEDAVGRGHGTSRKQAEQAAARDALERLGFER